MAILKYLKEHFSYFLGIISPYIFAGFISWCVAQSNADHNMQKMTYKESYKELKNQIRNLSYVDGDIYIFCKNSYREDKSKFTKELLSFYYNDLNDLYVKRTRALDDLINTTVSMQEDGILSEKSVNLVKEFTSWNAAMDVVGSRNDAICKMPLKNQNEIKKWRKDLIVNVLKYR